MDPNVWSTIHSAIMHTACRKHIRAHKSQRIVDPFTRVWTTTSTIYTRFTLLTMSQSAAGTNTTNSGTRNVEYFLLDENGNEQADDGTQEILSPIFPRISGDPSSNYDDNDEVLVEDQQEQPLLTSNYSGDDPSGLLHSHHRRSHRRRRARASEELSGRNILNALTYGIHLACWWGVAVWGLDGIVPTHWEETQRYETLITPATWNAHYLWIPILLTEAAFSIAQLFPHYRARPVVTGIGYRFFYTVLLQIAFTFLYSFGIFIGSFITAVLTLLALLSLLSAQRHHIANRRRHNSITEYALFQFPFLLHAGWMILVTVEHYSLLFRRYSSHRPSLQLASDMVALGALLAVGAFCLSYHVVSDFVIPTVILWSYVRYYYDVGLSLPLYLSHTADHLCHVSDWHCLSTAIPYRHGYGRNVWTASHPSGIGCNVFLYGLFGKLSHTHCRHLCHPRILYH
jgi:hypothetical protein